MKKIPPDPPVLALAAAEANDPLLDRAAAERALNYYLQNHKPLRPLGTALFAIPHSVNSEAALAQVSDLLCCAAVWLRRCYGLARCLEYFAGGSGIVGQEARASEA